MITVTLTAPKIPKGFAYTSAQIADMMDTMAVATTEAVKNYYATTPKAAWENPNNLTHGDGRRSTRWAENLKTNWDYTSATSSTGGNYEVSYTNPTNSPQTAGSFRAKVYGAIITPKNASALTIPINPLAHGHTVRELAAILATPIFAPPDGTGGKKDYLAANIDGVFTPLYVLRTQVTQQPWPNALPETSTLTAAATQAQQEWQAYNPPTETYT